MITNGKTMREFDKADDIMLEQAQTMNNLFTFDKLTFTTFYTHLADPFQADWQTAINTAVTIPTSEDELLDLKVLTEDVLIQMDNCRVIFQKLMSYVKIIYPNSPAKQGSFGSQRYEKVRESQTKMYELILLAHRKASNSINAPLLIAAGFLQADIDSLATIAQSLYDTNEEQEEFKMQIKIKTEDRIVLYNAVWGFMQQVSRASKQIFVNNFVKKEQYQLYPTIHGALGKVQNLSSVFIPASGGNPNTTDMSWDLVEAATGYDIARSIVPIGSPSGTFNVFATTTDNVYQDVQMPTIPAEYYYKIKARSEVLVGPFSDVTNVQAT